MKELGEEGGPETRPRSPSLPQALLSLHSHPSARLPVSECHMGTHLPQEPPQSWSLCEFRLREKFQTLGRPLRSGQARELLDGPPPALRPRSPDPGSAQAWVRKGVLLTQRHVVGPESATCPLHHPHRVLGRLLVLQKRPQRLREAEPLPQGHTAIQ